MLVRTDNTTTALPTVVHSGTQTDIVERCSSPVRESDACPRDSEFGCRPLVQRKSPFRRVEAAPSCSESDLARVRSCCSGPVCISSHDQNALLGVQQVPLYTFPPLALIPSTLLRVQENHLVTDFGRSSLVVHALAGGSEAL